MGNFCDMTVSLYPHSFTFLVKLYLAQSCLDYKRYAHAAWVHCCCFKSKINQRLIFFIHCRALQVTSYMDSFSALLLLLLLLLYWLPGWFFLCPCRHKIFSRLIALNVCEGKSISQARRACAWQHVERSVVSE